VKCSQDRFSPGASITAAAPAKSKAIKPNMATASGRDILESLRLKVSLLQREHRLSFFRDEAGKNHTPNTQQPSKPTTQTGRERLRLQTVLDATKTIFP
jgi:hypothetical protein